jgi:hypothetical protein
MRLIATRYRTAIVIALVAIVMPVLVDAPWSTTFAKAKLAFGAALLFGLLWNEDA